MEKLSPISRQQLLELVPQQRPFRFVDEIVELDENRILGRYTFRHDENFYAGHFPGNPVTPGVILVESMAQVGVVALGIYLLSFDLPQEDARKYTTFFTDGECEFSKSVAPGTTVIIRGEKIFWRRMKLRSKIEMSLEDGTLVARATLAGMGVKL